MVVAVLFVVSQLALPAIATHVARNRLSAYGQVQSVSLSAFPAVELIWGHVDSMTVRMATYRASGTKLSKSLGQADQVTNINAHIGRVSSGLLTLQNVTVTKRGKTFHVQGEVTQAALRSALPVLDSVTPLGSVNGVLKLQATGTLFGATASADVDVYPQNGTVQAAAEGLLGTLLHVTVFSSPRLAVTAVSGRATANGLEVSATGQMR